MKKIVVTTTSFAEYDNSYLNTLKKEGFQVVINPYKRKITSSEFVELAKEAVGLIAGTELILRDTMEKLPSLKVISRCGSGLDNIDSKAANRLGIRVFNTPDVPTIAVAELTVGLILGVLRKINQADKEIKEGKWNKRMGNLLSGKKIGIFGFGKIGNKVVELLKPFYCEIAYYDPFIKRQFFRFKKLTKERILKWADIISIHVSTNEMILGRRELMLMKKGSFLINVSRGGVLDELALFGLLKSGRLGGAAIDVFEKEPYAGPLKQLDNVILTPHVGSYAKEARIKMERQAVNNLLKALKRGK